MRQLYFVRLIDNKGVVWYAGWDKKTKVKEDRAGLWIYEEAYAIQRNFPYCSSELVKRLGEKSAYEL